MRDWHVNGGWADVGYHYYVKRDGTIQTGRPLEKTPAAPADQRDGAGDPLPGYWVLLRLNDDWVGYAATMAALDASGVVQALAAPTQQFG